MTEPSRWTRVRGKATAIAARARGLRTKTAEEQLAETAATFWDEKNQAESIYWTQHPLVMQHVNELVTGVFWVFPTVALKAGWAFRPWKRGISIGCGSGALERNLRLLNVCRKVDGFDISKASIREAKRLAKEEEIDGIRYHVADCNVMDMGRGKYDSAFFHGSLHHIADPDGVLDRVGAALRSPGMIYLDDYVGPSRDEWRDEHLAHAREAWATVPDSLKLREVNAPLDYSDPTEMIRSSRIRPALEERFEILHYKPYWGNLLFPLLCTLDGAKLLAPGNEGLVGDLIAREDELVAQGVYTDPLFAVILARKN
ncbi:MAG: class I SAM-dependent methyltransferase [Acidobacteria bacterium]|nr:class I SAM-dependent methyltransferase [Acidobacteriota bacterium]